MLAFGENVYAHQGKKHGLPVSARPASNSTKAKVSGLFLEIGAFLVRKAWKLEVAPTMAIFSLLQMNHSPGIDPTRN